MLIELNTIKEAVDDIRAGKVVIVVDNEDRENEGDFICAAELITPEIVNFMATYGRGLICAPIPEKRCEQLELELMVRSNTSLHAPRLRYRWIYWVTVAQQAFPPVTGQKPYRSLG